MSPISTTLPTEPGTYLFCGFREGRISTRDLSRLWRVEVVQVTLREGKLAYIGTDFFYRPEQAVGSWTLITELAESMFAATRDVSLDAIARKDVKGAFTSPWSSDLMYSMTRAYVTQHLTSRAQLANVEANAEAVFDRAVSLGLIEPDPKAAGYWKWVGG